MITLSRVRDGRRRWVSVVAAVAVGCVLSACSGSAQSSESSRDLPVIALPTPVGGPPAVAVDDALAARLPDFLRDSGRLTVGVDPDTPPMAFIDDGQVTGFEVELAGAVADVLGLDPVMRSMWWDDLRPAVAQGTVDVAWSYVTVTPERLREFDFVPYLNASITWLARSDSFVDPADLCGLMIAGHLAGGINDDSPRQANLDCLAAGEAGMTWLPAFTVDEAASFVLAGDADLTSADQPVSHSLVGRSGGELQEVGVLNPPEPLGAVVARGSAVGPLIRDALEVLIERGTYAELLTRWSIAGDPVNRATLVTGGKSDGW